MTYQSMTAQELHALVERLEAHGFKAPAKMRYAQGLARWRWELHTDPLPDAYAAAIIEVAARGWWLRSDPNIEDGEGYRDLHICLAGVNAHGCHIGDLCDELGSTPLHAIVAALEAKEGK